MRNAVLATVADFRTVMDRGGVEWKDWCLDDYLVALAQFTLVGEALSSDHEAIAQTMNRRKEICGSDVQVREWAPGSLKTYVNALAQTCKELLVSPSCLRLH